MSVIPKEQLAGFQRWQINSFDQKPSLSTLAPQPMEEIVAAPSTQPSSPPPDSNEAAPDVSNPPTAEDIASIHEEARQAGHAEGYAEGKAAAEAEMRATAEETLGQAQALFSQFKSALDELDQAVATQVLDLALEVARQMTRSVLQTQAEVLQPIIKEALASLPVHHTHLTLHLNPAEAASMRSALAEQISHNNLQIFENKDITAGGCKLISTASEVDATIETRWQRVLEAIGAEPQAWLIQK